jgi:hypothetical protein
MVFHKISACRCRVNMPALQTRTKPKAVAIILQSDDYFQCATTLISNTPELILVMLVHLPLAGAMLKTILSA